MGFPQNENTERLVSVSGTSPNALLRFQRSSPRSPPNFKTQHYGAVSDTFRSLTFKSISQHIVLYALHAVATRSQQNTGKWPMSFPQNENTDRLVSVSCVVQNFIHPRKNIRLRDYRLYYPLCISHIIYTWQIVYLSNKDPCPKIYIHKSEIKVPWTAMEIHKFQHPKSGSP